jgi:hypothetical protein
MTRLYRIIPPAGCSEANYGTQRFTVHDDGTMSAPRDAVEALLRGPAGFVLAPGETLWPRDDAPVAPAVEAASSAPVVPRLIVPQNPAA